MLLLHILLVCNKIIIQENGVNTIVMPILSMEFGKTQNIVKICKSIKFAFFVTVKPIRGSCCKKRQKSPNQETGFGNKGHLKVLNDIKLVLNDHELSPLII